MILKLVRYFIDNYLINEKFSNQEYILPKNIYCFWDNYEKSPLIQAHINTWKRKISNDWNINIITKKNIYDYVSEDFVKRYGSGKIDATRFSDFLRIDLLKNKGGCWMDASIFLTDGDFLDNIRDNMIKNKKDAFFYEYKEKTIVKTEPHLDNWFIMAPKNSKIITDLYSEFDKAFEMGFLQYKKQIIIPSRIVLKNTIGYGDDTYLLQHAILQYLFKKGNKYNLLIGNASESMYKLQENFKWDTTKLINFIINNNVWNKFYGVKLTRFDRKAIKDEKKFIQKLNSL